MTPALAEAARQIRELARGESWADPPLGNRVRLYLEAKADAGFAEATVRTYRGVLKGLVVTFADLDVEDFEPPAGTERLIDFLSIRYGGLSPQTRALAHAALADFFRHEVRRERLSRSPMEPIRAPKKRTDSPLRAMPLADARKLVRAHAGRDHVALALMLYCGLRRSELRHVQLGHIDIPHADLAVVAAKGGGCPHVKFPPSLGPEIKAEILRRGHRSRVLEEFLLYPTRSQRFGTYPNYEYRTSHEFRDRPMSECAVWRWWQRCLARAGLPTTWKPHEMRHTAISEFIRANKGDLLAAKRFARHVSIQTTFDVYGHIADAHMGAALDSFYKRVE